MLLTSRTGDGEVLTRTYGGFKGSETELMRAGVIPAGTLDGLRHGCCSALLLTAGAGREEIADCVATISVPHARATRPAAADVNPTTSEVDQ